QRTILKYHGDFLADLGQLLLGVIRDVLKGYDDAPGVGLEKAYDVVQRNRFPYSASAQDAQGFSRHHEEADVVENAVLTKRFADFLKLDIGFARPCRVRHVGSARQVILK